jgi:hypothetical protein
MPMTRSESTEADTSGASTPSEPAAKASICPSEVREAETASGATSRGRTVPAPVGQGHVWVRYRVWHGKTKSSDTSTQA